MDITSSIYRGHEIVRFPTGKCLVHEGDRSGLVVAHADSQAEAMEAVDRLRRQATGQQS